MEGARDDAAVAGRSELVDRTGEAVEWHQIIAL
jgi:hypothetical protein